MMSEFQVYLCTAANVEEARRIAEALVVEKLAACVNVAGGVESFFWWEDKVNREQETLLIIKSTKELSAKIIERIKQLHSYDVPEVIQLAIEDGSADYLRWISESVGDG
jgi:periplasmic divalent cation tolerance protein